MSHTACFRRRGALRGLLRDLRKASSLPCKMKETRPFVHVPSPATGAVTDAQPADSLAQGPVLRKAILDLMPAARFVPC